MNLQELSWRNYNQLMPGVFLSAEHHKLGTNALAKVQLCAELKQQKEVEAAQDEEEKLRQKVLVVHQMTK